MATPADGIEGGPAAHVVIVHRAHRRLRAAVVLAAHLGKGPVLAQRKLVTHPHISLEQRRFAERTALQAEDIGDRQSIGAENRLAEIRAGRIVVDQRGRIGLAALVVRARSLHRQALGHAGHDLQLAASDPVVRSVGDEGQIAEALLRVEELDDGVLPVFLVDGAVDLHADD